MRRRREEGGRRGKEKERQRGEKEGEIQQMYILRYVQPLSGGLS